MCTIIFWKYIMENKISISHYQTTADETIGQTIELMQYSTLYLILPFIYTVPYSHHRNSSYLCRIEGCVRHFDTRAQLERHRKDKHGPTEACPHCRYVVPQSRPYLMRNHLEFIVYIMCSQTVSRNHPLCLLPLCCNCFCICVSQCTFSVFTCSFPCPWLQVAVNTFAIPES